MEVLKQAGFMENRARIVKNCQGQSVAEYAVVLALIVIVAVTVLMGVGERSRTRLANVDTVLGEHPGGAASVAGAAAAAAADTSAAVSKVGHDSESGSGSNQEHDASAGKH